MSELLVCGAELIKLCLILTLSKDIWLRRKIRLARLMGWWARTSKPAKIHQISCAQHLACWVFYLRYWLQVKETRFHHYFYVWHQVGIYQVLPILNGPEHALNILVHAHVQTHVQIMYQSLACSGWTWSEHGIIISVPEHETMFWCILSCSWTWFRVPLTVLNMSMI